MMGIDTELEGSPDSIDAAARWLEHTLAEALGGGGELVATARRVASSDWDGAAAAGFVSRMGVAVEKLDLVHRSTSSAARELAAYAGTLRRLQARMAGIRASARAAGLTVSAYVVEPPGAAGHPGAHQARVEAYERLAAEATAVRRELLAGALAVEDEHRGLSGSGLALTALDIAGGFGVGAVEVHSSFGRETGKGLVKQADDYLDLIGRDAGGFGNHDLEHWDERKRVGTEMVRRADESDLGAKVTSWKLGGALAVVGVGLDLAAGESPTQAVVSGGGGFIASVGAGMVTGAAVGSLIPVPGVGTAAGAVVGAGAGVFTSGAIDSIFEDGPDVASALEAGWESLKDTGGAIGGGVGAVVGGIGGYFD